MLSTFSIEVLFELDYLEITYLGYFTLQRSFDQMFLILARRLKIGHGLKLKLHHLIFSKTKTQKGSIQIDIDQNEGLNTDFWSG